VVFVSLGSLVIMQQWYVDAIYHGCLQLSKRTPLRIVWGLKETEGVSLPTDYDRDVFWIEGWVPQIEVLMHPITKVGITHCGLGGTFEFIQAGVLALCFPHFGDQPINAENLISRKAGLSLIDVKLADRRDKPHDDSVFKFEKQLFTAKDVTEKLDKLLNDPSFKCGLAALKYDASAAGGA
jgi:UDP:flavonoid glycosyltransferase YjiC (YdhE family)